jgi:hypothetical protein
MSIKQLPPALTAFAPSTPGTTVLHRGADVDFSTDWARRPCGLVPGAATLNVIGQRMDGPPASE